jgi:hypothetical protein
MAPFNATQSVCGAGAALSPAAATEKQKPGNPGNNRDGGRNLQEYDYRVDQKVRGNHGHNQNRAAGQGTLAGSC